jgi:uncharacterized protein (DUF305 family)
MRATAIVFGCAILASACADTNDLSGRDLLSQDDVASTTQNLDESGEPSCRGVRYWTVKDARTPHAPRRQVELIDTLVPHHRAAVQMADMELSRGSDAEVKAMAQMMKDTQLQEIDTLLRIREELTGCSTIAPLPDPHMEADMQRMMSLSGLELDVAFLDDMIPHHAAAISFTHNAMPVLTHAELRALAHDVVDAQAEEVGSMNAKKHELQP